MPVTADDLHHLVIEIFGDRAASAQAPTAAIGVIQEQSSVYVAVQDGVFHGYGTLVDAWNDRCDYDIDTTDIVDARYLLRTSRGSSEWAGYHAEMMIVGAMICANVWEPFDWAGVKALLGEHGGAVICANAPACWHCGNAMDDLEITYYHGSGVRSLTAWWNPVSDHRVAHGGTTWLHAVPGKDAVPSWR